MRMPKGLMHILIEIGLVSLLTMQANSAVAETYIDDAQINAAINSTPSFEPAPALAHPMVRGGTFTVYNSDQILHRENSTGIGVSTDQGALQFFGLEAIQIQGTARWVRYEGNKAFVSTDLKPDRDLRLSFSAGAGRLRLIEFFDKPYDTNLSIALWRIRTVYTLAKKTEIRAEGTNDFSYLSWVIPDNQSQIMPVENYLLESETFALDNWQARITLHESLFGDMNASKNADGLLLRQVSRGPVHLDAGIGAGLLTFNHTSPTYWSPRQFKTYGLRMVMTMTIASHWDAEGRFAYGYHRDGANPEGKESAAELHLQYRTSNGCMLRILATFLDSENGDWYRNDLGISAEIPI